MRRLMSSAAVAVILFAAGNVAAATAAKAPAKSVAAAQAGSKGATFASVTTQLPRNVRPTHYDLSFTPDADKMSFSASVKIAIEVVEPTATVTLQAADLAFVKAEIAGVGGATVKVDDEAQTASFTFGKVLPKGKYVLALDYTGKIYTATLGAKPVISAPFSLQEAAGVPAGSAAPNQVNWYPGGVQQMALHRATGQLYVLMHMGEFWSHKAGANEVWQLDLASHKVVKRMTVPGEPRMIAVTQEAAPHLVFAGEDETVYVYDLATGKQAWKLDHAGNGVITVAQAQ